MEKLKEYALIGLTTLILGIGTVLLWGSCAHAKVKRPVYSLSDLKVAVVKCTLLDKGRELSGPCRDDILNIMMKNIVVGMSVHDIIPGFAIVYLTYLPENIVVKKKS